MSIVRVERVHKFTTLPNEALYDSRISLKAKGALAVWLSKPDDWRATSDWLSKMGPDGREACRAADAELQRAGYLYRYREQIEGGTWSTVTVIYDVALDPVPEITMGYQKPLHRPTGFRTPVNPDPGVPDALVTTEDQQLKNNRKNKTTTSSRPSRRAARARAEDTAEWSDPAAAVFAKEQDDDDSAPGGRPRTARNHGPDSAWGLNGYYRQHVFVAGTGRVGNTNDGALRRFFAEARRAGVPADTLRAMVDCFVDDPHLFNRTRTHRWKTFIANAPMLQDRAESAAYITSETDTRTPVDRTSSVKGVPKHILDEILAEAG